MTLMLDRTFAQLRQRGEKALITYVMAGDPSLQETEQLVVELERAGADIIELGVPFSDPIADGPVIHWRQNVPCAVGHRFERFFPWSPASGPEPRFHWS